MGQRPDQESRSAERTREIVRRLTAQLWRLGMTQNTVGSLRFWVTATVTLVVSAATAGWTVSQYLSSFDSELSQSSASYDRQLNQLDAKIDKKLSSIDAKIALFSYRVQRDESETSNTLSNHANEINTLLDKIQKLQSEIYEYRYSGPPRSGSHDLFLRSDPPQPQSQPQSQSQPHPQSTTPTPTGGSN